MSAKSLESSFPFAEEFMDCSGHTRQFEISLYKMSGGDFRIEAKERSPEEGYRFEVYSPVYSDPAIGSALGNLRNRIRERLATRYLRADKAHSKELTHNELRGRISYNGIIVDGSLLTFDDLKTILTTREGFEVRVVFGE